MSQPTKRDHLFGILFLGNFSPGRAKKSGVPFTARADVISWFVVVVFLEMVNVPIFQPAQVAEFYFSFKGALKTVSIR